ncbi:hypothetical protein SETIT_6G061800v2 [Setaria italica]|uniref:Embryo surrounding factor 1 brassicaceae domain-containing protein n=1 Tax=Setaria italica TaxID=4555 RepID=A0A368RIL0_SETIT|nr:hypothetical protein SETIT_6G061800v2 [Setaria italica]
MATFMMKSRRSSQGLLLLLSLLLLTFSVIPAPIRVIHDDIFNGCWPHDASASNVCCTKDKLCWPSLSECVINCPCKVRCNG